MRTSPAPSARRRARARRSRSISMPGGAARPRDAGAAGRRCRRAGDRQLAVRDHRAPADEHVAWRRWAAAQPRVDRIGDGAGAAQAVEWPDREVGVGAGRQHADLARAAEAGRAAAGRQLERVAGAERRRARPGAVGDHGHARLEPHRPGVGVRRAVDAEPDRHARAARARAPGATPTPMSRPAVAQWATPDAGRAEARDLGVVGEEAVGDPGAVGAPSRATRTTRPAGSREGRGSTRRRRRRRRGACGGARRAARRAPPTSRISSLGRAEHRVRPEGDLHHRARRRVVVARRRVARSRRARRRRSPTCGRASGCRRAGRGRPRHGWRGSAAPTPRAATISASTKLGWSGGCRYRWSLVVVQPLSASSASPTRVDR